MKTETEAKGCICPIRDMRNGMAAPCLGSLCMAWTWDNDGFQYIFDHKASAHVGQAYPEPSRPGGDGWERFDRPDGQVRATPYILRGYRRPVTRTGHCSALVARLAEVEVTMS